MSDPATSEVNQAGRRHGLLACGLILILSVVWVLWSGHREPWMLTLGAVSVLLVVWLTWHLNILDEESVPLHLTFRLVWYVPWLIKEIARANVDVARRVLNPRLPIRPAVVRFTASSQTELGRVILANSITLTPGTVSVDVQGESIRVHVLTYSGDPEDVAGAIDRRVTQLEGKASCTGS
jgi:multicomponent Na+:H+ antiporter subunit E